jgi:hypothetical protein
MRHKDEGGATAGVRFGSITDIKAYPVDVRFTPKADIELRETHIALHDYDHFSSF